MTETIKTKNLFHFFDNTDGSRTVALRNVSLNFLPGKITALIGPSGAGKTVLLKHLNGLLIPTSGQVQINEFVLGAGKKLNHKINNLRKNVGFLFQFPEQQLFEETVKKDILFGPKNFKIPAPIAEKNAEKVMKILNLPLTFFSRSPLQLSGGEKRKVAIGGVLAYEPKIILIDQLGRGLDPIAEKNFLNLILEMKKKSKKTIICASNNLDVVLEIADQIIFLQEGEVLFQGTPKELFFNERLLQKLNIKAPKTIDFFNEYVSLGGKVQNIKYRNNQEFIASLLHKKS